jgi:hypothetical protein
MTAKHYALVGAAAVAVLLVPAATVWYEYSGGRGCARCHEIQASFNHWQSSAHRNIPCTSCHGSALTFDVGFHLANLRRVARHIGGRGGREIHLKHTDLYPVVERCRACHQQEYAAWNAGPHGVTYAKIFLDRKHNTERLLMDDCLRCHGMHFQGAIRDLVTPIDTRGPWTLKSPELANRPAVPCLACHQMHRDGKPLVRVTPRVETPGPAQEIFRPSLAFYDRREQSHIPVRILPIPQMREGDRLVKMSPDRRQGLCYQCHAAPAGMPAGSGDDRTGLGVHEGLSCLACHLKHGLETRASCATCHPRLSNCGLDVEKMDTTFKDPKSPHNVHFVKCADCHPKGVPVKRAATPR